MKKINLITLLTTVLLVIAGFTTSAQTIDGYFNVCPNTPYFYFVEIVGGSGYKWTATGGTINGSSTQPSVSVNWSTAAGTKEIKFRYFKQGQGWTTLTQTIYPLAAGSISSNQTKCQGGSGSVTVSGAIVGPSNWQKQTWNGSSWSSWSDITGTSNTYSYSNIQQTTRFRAEYGNCNIVSSYATVTVNPTSVGGSVSGSKTGCASVSGSLTLSGHTGSIIRWQKSTNNGASWTNINHTSATLNYAGHSQTTRFRAEVKSGVCSSVYSGYATVTVDPTSLGGTISGSGTFCTSASGNLTLSGHRGSILKWEKKVGGGSWTNINNTSTTQSINGVTSGTDYRAQVKNGSCNAVYSNTVSININPASQPSALSGDISPCNSGSTALQVNLSNGTIVDWEYQFIGTNWASLGHTGSTYTAGPYGKDVPFRVVTSNGVCGNVYSNTLVVPEYDPTVAGTISGAGLVCSGSNGTLTLQEHTGAVQKWQRKESGGNWQDIANTSTTQDYTNISIETQYKAFVRNQGCTTEETPAVTVRIKASAPGTLSIKSGTNNTCGALASGILEVNGANRNINQFESSTDQVNWAIWPGELVQPNPGNDFGHDEVDYNVFNEKTYFRAEVQLDNCPVVHTNIITIESRENSEADAIQLATGTLPAYVDQASGTVELVGTAVGNQQWEQSTDDGINWNPINNENGNTYGFNITERTMYRLKATNHYCPWDLSNELTVDILNRGTITAPLSAAYGEEITLSFDGSDGYLREWQISFDGGVNFETLDPDYNTPLAEDDYKFTVLDDTQFRTQVEVANLGIYESDIVSVTVNRSATPQTSYDQVKRTAVLDPISAEAQIPSPGTNATLVNQAYFDGLGRTLQTITRSASPLQKDMTQFSSYDHLGRQRKSYMGYTRSTAATNQIDLNDLKTEQTAFYAASGDNITNSAQPFAEVEYEDSPLGRILKTYAPGATWAKDQGNRPVSYEYSVNVANEVIHWKVDDGQLLKVDTYAAGKLHKTTVTDENGSLSQTFTNTQGQVILSRVQSSDTTPASDDDWNQTYYVYDVNERLRFVVPPMATLHHDGAGQTVPAGTLLVSTDTNYEDITTSSTAKIAIVPPALLHVNRGTTLEKGAELYTVQSAPTNLLINQTFMDQWIYQYKYDELGRVIEKKVPGAEVQYFIYDRLDRLVLTQDGNLRAANQWTYVKYDELNRSVMTGLYTHGSSITQAAMQTLLDAETIYHEGESTTNPGYTNQAFPTTGTEVLTVSYYDDYDFDNDGTADYSYIAEGYTDEPIPFARTRGLATGGKVKILGTTNDWLASAVFYDKYGRAIQAQGQNHFGGTDRATTQYDFAGRALKSWQRHHTATDTVVITNRFDYDHAGRVLAQYQQLDSEAEILLASYSYNDLGQLIDKKLHSTDNGTTFEQSLDFTYNIRGWLTSLNDAALTDVETESEKDLWGMELGYDQSLTGLTTTKAYNGNISGVKWSSGQGLGTQDQKGYAYSYDKMNRFKSAQHYSKESTWASTDAFSVNNLSYDKNGNIESLTRKHLDGTTLDDLTYTYEGNQLKSVADIAVDLGFKDGNTSGDDYLYDANGNLTEDKNKGLTSIEYNHLNLPKKTVKTDNSYQTYTYTASGTKLAIASYDASDVLQNRTDYLGAFLYKDNVLESIQHADGRIMAEAGSGFEHQYHLKDHQGNIRLTFTTAPNTFEYLATMETARATEEESYFSNIDVTGVVVANYANHTDPLVVPSPNRAIRINNAVDNPQKVIGAAIPLQVFPGDTVKAEVFAKYANFSATNDAAIGQMAGFMTSAFGLPTINGETTQVFNFMEEAGFLGLAAWDDLDETVPRAYLNYILMDKNFEMVDFGFQQVSSAAEIPVSNPTAHTHEMLSFDLPITEEGYIYLYVSNESTNNAEVYFDDLKVTHVESKVVQSNDFYPFGLNAESFSRLSNIPNKFLYNAGAELNETSGNYETFYRHYDPVLGRFNAIDPLASSMASWTPYHYGFDNPITYNDPLGDLPLPGDKVQRLTRPEDRATPVGGGGGGSPFGKDVRLSIGSGFHWADGIERSDWSSATGSDEYRKEKAASDASGGYERDGKFYTRDGKEIVSKNGELYVKCEACGEHAGTSEDGTKEYYYNTYERYSGTNKDENESAVEAAAASAMGFIITDTSVPDPSDAVVWKWAGYGLVTIIAGAILYDSWNNLTIPIHNPDAIWNAKGGKQNVFPEQYGTPPNVGDVDWSQSDSQLADQISNQHGDSKRGPKSPNNILKKWFRDKRPR